MNKRRAFQLIGIWQPCARGLISSQIVEVNQALKLQALAKPILEKTQAYYSLFSTSPA